MHPSHLVLSFVTLSNKRLYYGFTQHHHSHQYKWRRTRIFVDQELLGKWNGCNHRCQNNRHRCKILLNKRPKESSSITREEKKEEIPRSMPTPTSSLFTPFVVSVDGLIGYEASNMLKQLSKRLADKCVRASNCSF